MGAIPERPVRTATPRLNLPPATPTPSPEDLERGAALIEKAVAGLGGPAAVDPIRTLVFHAESKRQTVLGELVSEELTRILFPFSFRRDVTLPNKSVLTMIVRPFGSYLVSGTNVAPLEDDQRYLIERAISRNPIVLVKTRRAAGITGGCGTAPLRFCPNDNLTRGQMAVFMSQALGLHFSN